MPNIILKDGQGVERTYSNKSSISVKNDQGGTTTFYLPDGKVSITDTQEVNVSQYAAAQIVDVNLVPENIAEDVTVLGITGTFKGGGNLQEKKEVYLDDLSPYANGKPFVVTPDDGYEGIKEVDVSFPSMLFDKECDILLGRNVLGINGIAEYKTLGYASLYTEQVLSSQILYINNRYDPSTFLRQFDSEEYLLATIFVGGSIVEEGMIYLLSATNTSLTLQNNDGQILATLYTVNNGWRYSQFDFAQLLPGATELAMKIDHNCGFEDIIDYCFAKKDIAFGDWVKRPTETLRITQNGTYDVSQYAQVIVNVGGGEGGDPVVDGKTLVFDDTTSVDGKTLVLGLDATVEGKTLIFGGAEEAVVDGKYLVTGGSVDGKTAILDGRVEGKTLIL